MIEHLAKVAQIHREQEMAANQPYHEDHPPARGDKYARESFTLRRMAPWQLWSISIACAIVVIAAVAYAVNL
jgi:hypothetical protein